MTKSITKVAAIDIETAMIVKGKCRYTLPIKSVSVTTDKKVLYSSYWNDNSVEELNELIDELIEKEYVLGFHNGKFDVGVLRHAGVNIPVNTLQNVYWHDTMCMSYVLYPTEMVHHSLSVLAELVDEEKLSMVHDDLLEYNIQDCIITAKLLKYFMPLLEEDESLYDYYSLVELPYIEVLIDIESTGLHIDIDALERAKADYQLQIEELRHQINLIAGFTPGKVTEYSTKVFSHYQIVVDEGKTFQRPYYVGHYKGAYNRCELCSLNTNSGAQVIDALKRLYKFKPTAFTAKGTPKTDVKTLQAISQERYPLIKLVLEQSKLSSIMSKFFISIGEMLDEDGIVFGDFNQFNTRTRRLSSSQPNLQNIPVRDERGQLVRKCFVPPKDYNLLVGDLDRIELVVLSYYLEAITGSTTLADMIRENVDVHTVNAKNWGVDRPVAKNGVFCVVYGGGRNKLAETLNIPRKEAQKLLDAMNDQFPEIFELKQYAIEVLEKNNGYSYDLFGGRIVIPEILSQEPSIRSSGERKSLNYLIQGTAGSIFKYLQIEAYHKIREEYQQLAKYIKFAAVVHDELLVYAHEHIDPDNLASLLSDTFTTNDLLNGIPISATFKAGDNWYDAK